MLLKDLLWSWPPDVMTEEGNTVEYADLGDIVVSVQNKSDPIGQLLEVRLRNRRGALYTVALTIPENIFQMVLFSIMRKKDMTLREVGNLEISY
jgi:hypothetical protein